MASHAPSPPRNLQDEVGKTDAFDLPEQEAYLNLVRTYGELHGAFDAFFKKHGISDPQYNALRIVAAAGREGVRSETIGAQMVSRAPDTTRLVDRLEKAELVERTRRSDDRRCVLVTITDKGRRLVQRLDRGVNALHEQQLGHLSDNQLRTLNRLLFLARHP